MIDVSTLQATARVTIAAPAATLYNMIADVTRMGEWSPVCKKCWWDEGAGPSVGAWFSGRNIAGERTWETRSEVVVAEKDKEFAWIVGGRQDGYARWGYTFTPKGDSTEVEESWLVFKLHPRLQSMTDEQVRAYIDRARTGMKETLANLKAAAESR